MNNRMSSMSIVLVIYTILICIPSWVYSKTQVQQQIQLKAAATLQRIKSDSETPVRVR